MVLISREWVMMVDNNGRLWAMTMAVAVCDKVAFFLPMVSDGE